MKKAAKLTTLVFSMFILAACTSSMSQTDSQSFSGLSRQSYNESRDADINAVTEDSMPTVTEEAMPSFTERDDALVIKTAHIQYQTIDYTQSKTDLKDIISKHDGVIQYEDESVNQQYIPYYDVRYGSTEGSKKDLYTLNLTVRVPQDAYQGFLDELDKADIAQLVSQTKGSDDVTNQVRDIQVRLDTIDTRIQRLNELNEQADTIEGLIQIETALNEAILERDTILTERDYLTEQVNDSTITIGLKEVLELDNNEGRQLTFIDRVKEAFKDTWVVAQNTFELIVIQVIYSLPYIIVALVLWLLYTFNRSVRKKSKHKNKSNTVTQTETQTETKDKTDTIQTKDESPSE